MTVADLIAELRTMPAHLPVRVLLSSFAIDGEFGDEEIMLDDGDALDAGVVRNRGGYVLIESR